MHVHVNYKFYTQGKLQFKVWIKLNAPIVKNEHIYLQTFTQKNQKPLESEQTITNSF